MNTLRKIVVHREWDPDHIYIIPITREGGIRHIEYPDGKGGWTVEDKPYGEPTNLQKVLKFNRDDAERLYQGLQSIFGKYQLEPKQAELDAVRYHLEDFRKLVFEGDIE
jgi:hypothetical protein